MAGRPVTRPLLGSAELPRAARRALRRHRSRIGALPRGHLDHAAARSAGWLAVLRGHLVRDRVRVMVRVRDRVRLRLRLRVGGSDPSICRADR